MSTDDNNFSSRTSKHSAVVGSATTFGTKATYAGSGTALIGGLAANEWLAVVGVLIAVLGFLTNLYFQHRRDKREEREHQRRMDHMATRPGDPHG
jgi:heme exporter protein D